MLVEVVAVFHGEPLEAVSLCAGGPWPREGKEGGGKRRVEGGGREVRTEWGERKKILVFEIGGFC